MENNFRKLIRLYISGWKENNIHKIIKPLAEDCVVIESHGSTYRGINQIRKWFDFWKREKGSIVKWEINSFHFVKEKRICFFEWDFSCNVAGKNHVLLGMSIVKFKRNKISFIHEYRMTKSPYKWNASGLNSE